MSHSVLGCSVVLATLLGTSRGHGSWGQNKPDDVSSRVKRVVRGLELMKSEENGDSRTSLPEEKTDTDSKSHLQIVGGFLHRKERRLSLPHYRKNKEQEQYYGYYHPGGPRKNKKRGYRKVDSDSLKAELSYNLSIYKK